MNSVRNAAVAGSFYPADPHLLHQAVQGYLSAVDPPAEPPPKAIIVPHAGYIYSGPIAASAFARLKRARDRVRKVVLIGPAHRVTVDGLALSSADAFSTPLGQVRLDRSALLGLRDLPFAAINDEAHFFEHSLEVQLPFLQELFDDFTLIPILAGNAEPSQVATVLGRLWDGAETLIVVSSDLSHYHDYENAKKMDMATSSAIEHLAPERIGMRDACGRIPVSGLLVTAREYHLKPSVIDLRNSGDTAGDRARVVGYGAYIFQQPPENPQKD